MNKKDFPALDGRTEVERLRRGLSEMQKFEGDEHFEEPFDVHHHLRVIDEQELSENNLFSEEELEAFPKLRL